jgi:hypothetical protein
MDVPVPVSTSPLPHDNVDSHHVEGEVKKAELVLVGATLPNPDDISKTTTSVTKILEEKALNNSTTKPVPLILNQAESEQLLSEYDDRDNKKPSIIKEREDENLLKKQPTIIPNNSNEASFSYTLNSNYGFFYFAVTFLILFFAILLPTGLTRVFFSFQYRQSSPPLKTEIITAWNSIERPIQIIIKSDETKDNIFNSLFYSFSSKHDEMLFLKLLTKGIRRFECFWPKMIEPLSYHNEKEKGDSSTSASCPPLLQYQAPNFPQKVSHIPWRIVDLSTRTYILNQLYQAYFLALQKTDYISNNYPKFDSSSSLPFLFNIMERKDFSSIYHPTHMCFPKLKWPESVLITLSLNRKFVKTFGGNVMHNTEGGEGESSRIPHLSSSVPSTDNILRFIFTFNNSRASFNNIFNSKEAMTNYLHSIGFSSQGQPQPQSQPSSSSSETSTTLNNEELMNRNILVPQWLSETIKNTHLDDRNPSKLLESDDPHYPTYLPMDNQPLQYSITKIYPYLPIVLLPFHMLYSSNSNSKDVYHNNDNPEQEFINNFGNIIQGMRPSYLSYMSSLPVPVLITSITECSTQSTGSIERPRRSNGKSYWRDESEGGGIPKTTEVDIDYEEYHKKLSEFLDCVTISSASHLTHISEVEGSFTSGSQHSHHHHHHHGSETGNTMEPWLFRKITSSENPNVKSQCKPSPLLTKTKCKFTGEIIGVTDSVTNPKVTFILHGEPLFDISTCITTNYNTHDYVVKRK